MKTKQKTLRVVIARPGQPAFEATIDNNLRGIQMAIGGGYIENVNLPIENVHGYCDEDGRVKGLAPNRSIPGFNLGDPIVGDIVVLGMNKCEERSLTITEVAIALELLNSQITFGG